MTEYTVTIGGIEHTMLLDEADAARLGAVPVKAATVPNKARKPEDKHVPRTRSK